jgi:non-ribosomal peptide synthetase component F
MQSNLCLLYCLIHEHAEKTPDALAILAPGKEPISYRQLADQLETIAVQLNRMGFRSSDRVAVALPNSPEMATAFLAISSVCTCAPLNPAYHEDEFTFGMKDLRAKALVTCYGSDHPARKAASTLGIPVLQLSPDAKYAGMFSISSNLPVDGSLSGLCWPGWMKLPLFYTPPARPPGRRLFQSRTEISFTRFTTSPTHMHSPLPIVV